MPGYVELLRTPGVARIMSAQLAARVPQGMQSLVILLHIERMHDSYAAAGLVLAAMSVGAAVAGPLTSRWMGVWGMRQVLTLLTSVCAAALLVLTFVPMDVWAQMIVALVAGLASPPVQSSVRTIYPKMVTADRLTVLFTLDATAQELVWIVGPVVGALLATQVSTLVAMLVVIAFLVVGGAWFIASPELGRVKLPRSRRRFGAVLGRPVVLISTVTYLFLVASFAALEASVVANFGDTDARSGIVLAIWSVASIGGGLLFGRVGMSPWSLARRLLFVFVGAALAILPFGFWWLAGALLVSGIGIAPAVAVVSSIVSSGTKFSETPEAFGWVNTGQLIGAASGAAVAGFFIDGFGSAGGFAASAGLTLLAIVVAIVTVRWIPDLRVRDAGSMPDTEPVPTQPS